MPDRTCESCGEGFWQGRGRAARRCPPCRGGDRYGAEHRATRAATVDQAVGQRCARCQTTILEGQPVDLDHADNGHGYLGYSHRRCNARAGAIAGNKARAQAYRAMRGMAPPPAANGSAAAVVVREPPPERPECVRTREEIRAGNVPLTCLCGRLTSRCW
jgi:hypothetical protein